MYGIVRQSGGHIDVESEIGKGTTIKVFLPRTVEVPGGSSLRPTLASTGSASETLLLVEDDPQVRGVMGRALRRQGYSVLEAPNGSEGLLLWEQNGATIDLVLTDVVMPRMGGLELAERVMAMSPSVRVLFVSGYADTPGLHKGVEEGRVAYLQKPVTSDALLKKVREILGAG